MFSGSRSWPSSYWAAPSPAGSTRKRWWPRKPPEKLRHRRFLRFDCRARSPRRAPGVEASALTQATPNRGDRAPRLQPQLRFSGSFLNPRRDLRGHPRFDFGAETDFIDRLGHILRCGWRQIGFCVTLQLRDARGVGEEGEETRCITVRRERVRLGEEWFHVRPGELPRDIRPLRSEERRV